jgi:hypothetical protein
LKTLPFLLLMIASTSWAAPKNLEVWFLSQNRAAQLMQILDRPDIRYHARTARLQCQEMGDFCFDPQFGLYQKGDLETPVTIDKLEQGMNIIAPAKSVERELIKCDANNFFDIFCGQARAEVAERPNFELWIDTSGSMREFDDSDRQGGCFRKSLVRRLDRSCAFNRRVQVKMFDVSIKEAGTMDSLCINKGSNDYKRMIQWIENSDAKNLVVITDIYEYYQEVADYVHSKGGKLRGDKDPLLASQLMDYVGDLAKRCN